MSSPFAKRGELDQGILRFTWYSLVRVSQGYALALILGVPFGFMLGISKTFAKAFDPLAQVLRPVSPLAWLPLGLVLFQKSDPAATFTIAMCSMWPTVLNTALGGGTSSRLFQEVREKRGLAYSVFTFGSAYVDTGMVGVYAGCLPKKAPEVLDVVRAELESIASGTITPDGQK